MPCFRVREKVFNPMLELLEASIHFRPEIADLGSDIRDILLQVDDIALQMVNVTLRRGSVAVVAHVFSFSIVNHKSPAGGAASRAPRLGFLTE
jgi:hypothetical protein